MLEPGLHVHDDDVVPAEDQVRHDRLEHHVLRADAAGAAGVDGAHDEKLHAVDVLGELVGQVRDVGVELIEAVLVVGAGALLGQLLHFGHGNDGVDFFLAQPQRQTQVRVRIDIGGEDRAPFVGVQPRERGGQRRLADAALAGDSYFHIGKDPPGASLRCRELRAWPRWRRSSCRRGSRCWYRRRSAPRPTPCSRGSRPAAAR